jgi:hypothetical protein
MRLAAKRRRASDLRRRAVVLSALLFAFVWTLVFGQMVSGHDPVLGSGQKAAATGSQHKPAKPTQPKPQPSRQPKQLEVDPATGQVVEVPSGTASPPSASSTGGSVGGTSTGGGTPAPQPSSPPPAVSTQTS